MIEDLTIRLLVEKFREIARNQNRDDAEGEAVAIEQALTGGRLGGETSDDTELLIAYLVVASDHSLDEIPAESHAAFLERLAVNPRVLSAAWRDHVSVRVASALKSHVGEISADLLAMLFARVNDATCRYLCVSTAVIFDGDVRSDRWLSEHETGPSAVESLIGRAVSDELNAGPFVNEVTETLLELWTHEDVRGAAEAALRRVVTTARNAEIPAEYFVDAIRLQAQLFESGEGRRLEELLQER